MSRRAGQGLGPSFGAGGRWGMGRLSSRSMALFFLLVATLSLSHQNQLVEGAPYYMDNEINRIYLNVDDYDKFPTDKVPPSQMVKSRCCKKFQHSMQTFVLNVFLHAVLFSAATQGVGANPCPDLCAQLRDKGRIYDACLFVCRAHEKPNSRTVEPVLKHLLGGSIQDKSWNPGRQGPSQSGQEVETVGGMVLWQKRRWGNTVRPCIVTHCGDLAGQSRLDCIVNKCNKRRR